MEITSLKAFLYELSSLITDLEIKKGRSAHGVLKKTLYALKKNLKPKERRELNGLMKSLLKRLKKVEKNATWELAELQVELDIMEAIDEVRL